MLSRQKVVLPALAALALLWSMSATIFYATPPWDNVEELFWGASLELGYYKHPPLPSWIIGMLMRLAGREPWLTYVAGAACGVGALFLVWKWATELAGPKRAALALLLGTLVTYHVQRSIIYNHNSVQLVWLAGYWWMLWRCLRGPAAPRLDWAWLGGFAALAFLTKYSAVVQFAVGFAFIVRQGLWRDRSVRAGLATAAAAAALMLAPHLWWMFNHPDLSVAYALHSVHSNAQEAYSYRSLFQVTQLQILRLAPMLLMVGVLWLSRPKAAALRPGDAAIEARTFDRRFLAWATFGPVCAVLAIAAAFQVKLLPSWLGTFYLPASLWAVVFVRGLDAENWSRMRWRVVVGITVVLQVAAAMGQGWVEGVWSRRLGYMTRANLPAGDVAVALEGIWQARAGGTPFKLLVGDTWFAGAVVLKMRTPVKLLVDGQERDSPWLALGALARDGGMVVILDNPDFRSEGALLEPMLAATNCHGALEVPWTGAAPAQSVRVRWGIVAPAGRAAPGC